MAPAFTLTLAPHFTKVTCIELSADSIYFATYNVELNAPTHKVTFRTGDDQISNDVSDLSPGRTALVPNPPRKGCDEEFVRQPLVFRDHRRRSCYGWRKKKPRQTGRGRGNTFWKPREGSISFHKQHTSNLLRTRGSYHKQLYLGRLYTTFTTAQIIQNAVQKNNRVG